MWIAVSDAFISAVADRNDPTRILVRARNPDHLKLLFPTAEVVLTPNADYGSRVFISREEFSRMLVERVSDISYDNFKNSVADTRLHRMYESMWDVHRQYQEDLSKPDRSRHMSWGGNDVVFHKRRD